MCKIVYVLLSIPIWNRPDTHMKWYSYAPISVVWRKTRGVGLVRAKVDVLNVLNLSM